MNRYPLLIMFFILGISWGLNALLPRAADFGTSGKIGGSMLLFLGATLMLVAAGLFKLMGTTVDPTKEPNRLVTDGIYRFTRNPMYLGMLLILIGSNLILNFAIGFMFTIIFFLMMDKIIIPKEEDVVEGVFGEVYREYKNHTRRWI